jgi:M6 family metalloprotease-like protein/uncharacterized repeat protein (TIGR02543 family)
MFIPPVSDGGSPITGYTVTANPGNLTATGTSSPIDFTGLTIGTAYSFTVTASNIVGESAPSSASYPTTARPYSPTTGIINNLVFFVRFSDSPEFTLPLSYYDSLFNTATNSLKSFYLESSYQTLTVNSSFYQGSSDGSIVSYQDPYPVAYYNFYDPNTNPSGCGHVAGDCENRQATLLTNALNAIKGNIPAGLNLDTDNDGYIDHITFEFYQTPAAPAPILFGSKATYDNSVGITINGKKIGPIIFITQYQTPATDFSFGGVEIHEMGHSLGYPDLYNTPVNNGPGYAERNPVDPYDIMSFAGGPVHSGAYEKYKFTHWIANIPAITSYGDYTINNITLATSNAYKISLPNTSEYLVLEYRKAAGTFESGLPGSGLCITRVNEAAGIWGNKSGPPFLLYYFRPDGTTSYDGPISNNYCLNAESGRTQFNDRSNPACFLSDGAPCGIMIYNIGSASGASISFSVGDPALVGFTHLIRGQVTMGGSLISGATVTLSGDTSGVTTTDSSGRYFFVVNEAGNYTVTPTKANMAFNPGSKYFTNVTSEQIQNFTASYVTKTISGTVSSSGIPLNGVTIYVKRLSDNITVATPTTDSSGNYSVNVTTGDSYEVSAGKPTYFFTPGSTTFTNFSADQTANFTTYTTNFTLSGTITYNGSALPGVSVSCPGAATTPVTTNGSGYYSCTVAVGDGATYTLTPSSPYYTFTPANKAYTSGIYGNQTQNFASTALPVTTTALNASVNPATPGQSITLTATVSGSSPTGSVTFNDGSTAVCSTVSLSAGQALCATSSLSMGSHSITAVYSGDGSNAGSTSNTLTQIIAAVPGAPTSVTATAGLGFATISFIAPTNNGATISTYTATSSPDAITGSAASAPITVNGLTNGTPYTFTVTATNVQGIGATSAISNSVTPSASVPGAPTIGTATGGNASASVSFSAPASDGGAAITGYTVTSNPGGFTGTGASSPITVSGLTNGLSYTFTVTAANIQGTGQASGISNSVIPATVPGAPTGVTAAFGNTTATVSFSAPSSNGSAITGYTVTSYPAGGVDSNSGTTSLSHIITGLTNGTQYTFTVTATNGKGAGSASSVSNAVIPATVPSAPTGVSAVAGISSATVTFSASASNGGSAITGYTVTSSPSGGIDSNAGTTGLSHTITGLTPGTSYTFTVKATNIAGNSAASTPVSNAVVPTSQPTLSLSQTSMVFGYTPQGVTSAGLSVTLTNGTGTLHISQITTDSDFSQNTTCGATLAGNANCTVTVTLTPSVIGLVTGSLVITSDATGSPHTVTLKGIGNIPGIALAAGGSHSLVLKPDGTIWSWGSNSHGQLGTGVASGDVTTPVQDTGLSGVTALSVGTYHTLGLMSDGSVWAWGYNGNGQFGDGATTGRSVPSQVTGLSSISSIATGGAPDHTIAVKSDGTVYSWGYNNYGQVGDGSTTEQHSPVQLTGLSGMTTASVASDHSTILKSDGTIWSSGYNGYYELGDGTGTQRLSPVQGVAANLSKVKAVAAGKYFTSFLKTNGTVWGAGYNYNGQLGDGTLTPRMSVQTIGLTDIVSISTGADGWHTLSLKADGTVWAWGYNFNGQLGDGSTTDRSSPVQVSGLSGIVAIAASTSHSMAIKSDGTVWTWGNNANGQLGDGSTTQRTTPVQISGFNILETVSFTSNGGSAVSNQSIAYNTTATVPSDPSKTGYTFAGWYSDIGLSTAFVFSTPITGVTTLYAKWNAVNYTVSFTSNGGSAVSNQSIAYNNTATTPTAPTRTGHTFAGWYSDSGLTSAFAFTTTIAADTTLYAKWTINNYTLTFTSGGNGSLTGTTSQTINYGGTSAAVTAVPATDYHFVNWTGDNGFIATSANPLLINPVTATQSITANFSINPVNGLCGEAINHTFNLAPTVNLCTTGTASAVTGAAQWSWTCNGGTTADCTSVIDVTAPTLTLSTLADGAITNNNTLNISGTVSDSSGISGMTVNNTPVPITNETFSTAITLQAGANTVTTIATDNANNQTTDTRTITLDKIAPTLTVTTPADNSKTAQPLATITGTIDETSTVTVTVNSGTQNASITGSNYSATVNLTSGLNTVSITATDLAGNTSSAVRTLTYDNSNPSLAITEPNQDITTTQSALTISGTVSDTITNTTVTISFNNQTYTPVINNGTFSQQHTIPTAGTYTITATATDEAGNSSSVARNVIYTPDTNIQTTLKAGWNLMGWTTTQGYYQGTAPQSTEQASSATMSSNTMSTVFTTMGLSSTDSFVVVGPDGVVYMPGSPFNTLKKTLPGKAYWIYTPSDKTITVPGSTLLPTDQLQLNSGWNQIAYWGTDGVAPATGFNCINGLYDILVDETGKVYMSGSPFNTLKTLQKYKGYFIHTTAQANLVYQCSSTGVK